MTQNLERSEDLTAAPPPQPGATKPKRWWRRPWLLPLAFVFAGFFALVLPAWLTFDPARARVPIDPAYSVQYQLILLHLAFGITAYLTVILQLWPWLRREHPVVHRFSGRVYVFGGALPAAVTALLIIPADTLFPIAKAGTLVWATLALSTTIAGFRAARQRRYADHRRWMLYSFAVVAGVVTGRALAYLTFALPGVGPYIFAFSHAQIEGFWLGWLVNLALVHWWLRRTARKSPGSTPLAQPV